MEKRIIVVGASSGIGRGLAEIYAKAGWRVGVTGRRKELLIAFKAKYPKNVFWSDFDVAKDDVEEKLTGLTNELGGLDLLVISAGVGYQNPALETAKELETVQTDVVGFLKVALWAFDYFKTHNGGHLAGISSIAGIRGLDICPSYSASKGFEAILLESLRRKSYQEQLGISVTTIIPGFVDTAMGQSKQAFWRASVEEASRQIYAEVEKKRDKVYVTERWRYVAFFLKFVPDFLFKRVKM